MTRLKIYTYREVKMTVEVNDSDTTGTKVVTFAYFLRRASQLKVARAEAMNACSLGWLGLY